MSNVINHRCAFPAVTSICRHKHIGASIVKIFLFVLNFNISDCTHSFIVLYVCIVACCEWEGTVYLLNIFDSFLLWQCVRMWVLWVMFSALTGKKKGKPQPLFCVLSFTRWRLFFQMWKQLLKSETLLQWTPNIQQCYSVTTSVTLERNK